MMHWSPSRKEDSAGLPAKLENILLSVNRSLKVCADLVKGNTPFRRRVSLSWKLLSTPSSLAANPREEISKRKCEPRGFQRLPFKRHWFLRLLSLGSCFRTRVNSFIPSTNVYLVTTVSGTKQGTGTQPWRRRHPPCCQRTEGPVKDSFIHSFTHCTLFIECLLCVWHCSRD